MTRTKIGVRFKGIPDDKDDIKGHAEAQKAPKQSMVLTDTSLQLLSREVGNIILFCMYLNVPTTRLVNIKLDNDEKGKSDKDLACRLLWSWKKMRENSKDKDKVRDLERALREVNKPDLADILMDRHANQMELTPDVFQ